MLLTITTTHSPATDLGYLLHKNPASFQTAKLPFGQAHVFFTEAADDRCTAAVVLDVDPVALVRRPDGGSLRQYVNDRPYVASSLLSVALARLFATAMGGRSKERPELAASEIPLRAARTACLSGCSDRWATRSRQRAFHSTRRSLAGVKATTTASLCGGSVG